MTDADAEDSRLRLIAVLTETAELLRRYSVNSWLKPLSESRCLIELRDVRGVDRLSQMFGGMGSFNDIVIHPLNGNPITEADIHPVNEKFQALKSQIYELAAALRRYSAAC